jgi:hypothetical protein
VVRTDTKTIKNKCNRVLFPSDSRIVGPLESLERKAMTSQELQQATQLITCTRQEADAKATGQKKARVKK